MRTLLLPCLAAAVVLGPVRPARAQDDARAVVAKAVKALGGAERLARPSATLTKIKGSLTAVGPATFTGDLWVRKPGEFKTVFRLDVGGAKTSVTQVMQGDKGWVQEDNGVHDPDPATLADMKESAYHDRVMSLLPLLEDKTFTLTALGPGKVDGRATVGVAVTATGRPEVTLHFDAASGLLARSEYRVTKAALGKAVATAWAFDDYREVDPAAAEESLLKTAKVAVDGPSLLKYLRGQVRGEAERAKVKGLVQALADESFEEREKATADLVRLGGVAVPQLREAARSADVEVAKRAKQCLARIEEGSGPDGALTAALRLVALRQPEGAAEVLLSLAPSLPDEGLARELRAALAAVAVRGGKPDPLVEKALSDKDAARRAAAAAALGRDGGAFEKQPGRRLLVGGVKKPHKVTMYQDGKKEVEWEVIDVQYFNKFDDSLFARPR